jgi:tRNA A37 threonylcarbamoyladenosine synthetase subunit TsaC/SUA5/YrdC
VESTVLDLTQGKPIVVRAGAIPLEELEEALGTAVV